MSSPPFLPALRPVVAALEALDVPYYIGGSVASSVYGEPRTTVDVDLVAELRSEHVRSFVQSLGENFYADEERIRQAIRLRRSFNVIHLGTNDEYLRTWAEHLEVVDLLERALGEL